MTTNARGVSHVPKPLLEQVLVAIERGRLDCPLAELDLQEMGLGPIARSIAQALNGLNTAATMAALRLILADRAYRPPPRLDLVWSGPDARGSVSRDTAMVIKRLFGDAERTVLIGGYAFDEPEILAPLHLAMKQRGVTATVFMNIEATATTPDDAVAHATAAIDKFFHDVWTFGPPRPDVYFDPLTAMIGPPWVSLHAKCVVVDDARALVTSANFTDRAQNRNIEVGVLIEDPAFASELSAQWRLLIGAGLVRRYGG